MLIFIITYCLFFALEEAYGISIVKPTNYEVISDISSHQQVILHVEENPHDILLQVQSSSEVFFYDVPPTPSSSSSWSLICSEAESVHSKDCFAHLSKEEIDSKGIDD